MKTGIFTITVLSLLRVTAALPKAYSPENAKRGQSNNLVDFSTEVIVSADQNVPVRSKTTGQRSTSANPTLTVVRSLPITKDAANRIAQTPVSQPPRRSSTPAPTPPPGGNSNAVDLSLPPLPLPSPTKNPLPLSVPPLVSPPKAPGSPNFPGNGLGICYAPYGDNGECKTPQQVESDFSKFGGFDTVRFYGTDCNQVPMVVAAANKYHKKLFAGIYDIEKLDEALHSLIQGVQSSWALIVTVAIGNERVNSGQSSVSEVVASVSKARKVLRDAGYTGPVVTVDTFNALIAHPELCKASDFCAANIHAFFDPNTEASNAGGFVKEQQERVSRAAGGKMTVVTESGWPKHGNPNGKAIPSPENHNLALASLLSAFKGKERNLYLFSAFDDKWKKDDPSTFGAEKYWGIF
ncbi:cell wall glucanase (Scw4) [Histoplasma capsulatum G186AR]|uniref:Cell wall glucanase (Scw4) n=1 Tax=Ajellomyces capsulatus TaxID=5037 RepID=A0A8H7Z7H4_AJECA|nr:cell wall glucanase (Scw4) [Histoplasma capsulatum]QSS69160.1 cell wall glucanase (Scw4) [Histoplasma capsulatum G186AR]